MHFFFKHGRSNGSLANSPRGYGAQTMRRARAILPVLTSACLAAFGLFLPLLALAPSAAAQPAPVRWTLVKVDRVPKLDARFASILGNTEHYDARGGRVDIRVDGNVFNGYCAGGFETMHFEWQFAQDITHMTNGETRAAVIAAQPLLANAPCNGNLAAASTIAVGGSWPYDTPRDQIDSDRVGIGGPYKAFAKEKGERASPVIGFASYAIKTDGPFAYFTVETCVRFAGCVYYVYMYKNEAAAGISLELGVNRPGGDYDNRDAPNAAACQASCGADLRCMAFTYVNPVNGAPNGHCWLKATVPAPQADPCCVSGIRETASPGGTFTTEVGVNRRGSDYAQSDLDSPDPQLCRAKCAADGRCRAFTYVGPVNASAKARCWLKDAVPPPVPDSCCTSGVRQ